VNWWVFTLRNLRGSLFRSLSIVISAALVASLVLAATQIIAQARQNMEASLHRLGADIIVIPFGTMTQGIEGARLMSQTRERWMPRSYLHKIAAVPGVGAVSPQLFLGAYAPDGVLSTYVLAYEPESDFTLLPWLETPLEAGLKMGEAVAGSHVQVPGDGKVNLYGYPLVVVRRLAATHTDIDRSLFTSFETGYELAAMAQVNGRPFARPAPQSITAAMVRVDLGSDPHAVSLSILEQVPGVIPLENPQLFQSERRQLVSLIRTVLVLLGFTWLLAVFFSGLTFSLLVNERRQEIGVLRALGASRRSVTQALLLEGALLALFGGLLGVLLTSGGLLSFSGGLENLLGMPFQSPEIVRLLLVGLLCLFVSTLSALISALIPVRRIYRMEVSLAMRE
jgi:putative ABC transport system permease protein